MALHTTRDTWTLVESNCYCHLSLTSSSFSSLSITLPRSLSTDPSIINENRKVKTKHSICTQGNVVTAHTDNSFKSFVKRTKNQVKKEGFGRAFNAAEILAFCISNTQSTSYWEVNALPTGKVTVTVWCTFSPANYNMHLNMQEHYAVYNPGCELKQTKVSAKELVTHIGIKGHASTYLH